MNTDRQSAIDKATRLLDDSTTVFLKVETTGLDASAEVVEIAIVEASTGNIILNTLVQPCRPYKLHSKLKHGIAFEDLKDAPAIHKLNLPLLLDGKKVVVYGRDFAQKMIRQSYLARSLGFGANCLWYCAMTIYGEFEGVLSDWGDGYKWWRFDDALENLHVNNTARNHRALEEARSIGLLLYNIAYRGDAQTVKRDDLPTPISLDETQDDIATSDE